MSLDVKYASAIALLKGSDANYALCCVSMTASFGLAIGGIVLMTDDSVKRVLMIQSIIFLVAQAFTFTRVSRDWNTLSAGNTARPTFAYFVQVVAFFILAFGLSVYSLATSVATLVEWRGFYAMSLLWSTVSALCLSKAVRDRSDSSISAKLPVESQAAHLPELLQICKATIEYKIFVWASALLAVGAMLGIVWTWDAEVMAIERKGFITTCVLWCEVSSFHLAKLVRDRADPLRAKELRLQLPFQVLVVASSISSFAVLLGGIVSMPLSTPKKVFLVVGSGFMLTTAFFLAKHVRDHFELGRIDEIPDPEHPVHATVVESTDAVPSAF
jgi:hypothetical protein